MNLLNYFSNFFKKFNSTTYTEEKKQNISFYVFYHDDLLLNEVTNNLHDERFSYVNLNELTLPKDLHISGLTPQENKAIFSEYLGLLLVKPKTDLVGFFTYSIPKKFSVGWAKETGEINLFIPEIRFQDFQNVPFEKDCLYAAEFNNPSSKFPREIENIHQKFRVGDEKINCRGPYKGSFIVDKQSFIAFQEWFAMVVKYVLSTYKIDQWGLENSLYSNSEHAGKDEEYLELDKLRHGIGELLERCVAYYFAQKYMDDKKIKLNDYLYHQKKPKYYAETLKKVLIDNTVIVVFADQHEKKSLDEWLKNTIEADVNNTLVITFDKAIYVDLKTRGQNVLLEEKNTLISNQKIQIILDILSYDVNVCYSSLDTLWQKNSSECFTNKDADILLPEKNLSNNALIIVFANYNYLPVLENWLAAMRNINVQNYLIISLDEELHLYLQQNNVNSLFRPCELDLGKLWIHRADVILELMEKGHDIIHSDADAIWLKDPQPYLKKLPQDMIFSQGTIWPPDVQEKWGFVLCCGFFFLRSNPQTLQFVRKLAQRVRKDKDDQVSCNRLLIENNVAWDNPVNPYTIDFRGKQFTCSTHIRTGKSKELTIALLPHKTFQRIFEEADDVYVRHLISEKNSEDILDVLEQYGCRFV